MSDEDLKSLSESIKIMMGFIGDLSLRVETCRVLLRAQGVTDEEFDAAQQALKKQWESSTQPLLRRIGEKRTAERLRRLLESAEGTKQ